MNTKLFAEVKEYIIIALGCLVYTLGWKLFFFPHEIAGGGATGIATIIMYGTQGMLSVGMTNFFEKIGMASVGGGIPVSFTYLLFNVGLLIASVKILGWKFSLRTIYGVICITIWFWVPYDKLFSHEFPSFDPFMSTILGSIIMGLGIGYIFMNNGSTGGTDIVAKIINKYRSISLGKAMLICDLAIITSALFFPYGNIEKVVYGFISTFVCTTTIDMMINGTRQSVQFFIFSKEYARIADEIQTEIKRGVTVINGQGWYSKEDVKVIAIMCRRYESNRVFNIIKNIDKDAFITQTAAMGVYGKGFDIIGQK